MSEPVDAVITWVDGQDPVHQNKLAKYLASLGIERPESAAPTRFNSCGELDYCVRSLLRFAPWIRTIYIVTDAQTPAIIMALVGTPFEGRVILVDHRDIFTGFEEYLPTFNSLSIESVLWRIKGLSNKFIYLNDDCSLIRPVVYEDFFRGDKLVVRGEWKTMSEKKWCYTFKPFVDKIKRTFHMKDKPAPINAHRVLQETSAQLAGYLRKFFHLPHAPFPLKKLILEQFFLTHPEMLSKNLSYPLRDRHQFWPVSLVYHLELKHQTIVVDNTLQSVMVNGACHSLKKIKKRLSSAENNPHAAFICMQSLDAANTEIQAFMLEWLDKRT